MCLISVLSSQILLFLMFYDQLFNGCLIIPISMKQRNHTVHSKSMIKTHSLANQSYILKYNLVWQQSSQYIQIMKNTNIQDNQIESTRKIKVHQNLMTILICHELQEIMQNKIMRFTFTRWLWSSSRRWILPISSSVILKAQCHHSLLCEIR